MDQRIEDFFFGRRGKSVDAADVQSLCGFDRSLYVQALRVARGNNVHIHNEYRSRHITGEVEYAQREFAKSLAIPPKNR